MPQPPAPARNKELKNSRSNLCQRANGYFLCVKSKRAIMKSPVVKMTINSSYVLIKTTPFRKTRKQVETARSPAVLWNILCMPLWSPVRRAQGVICLLWCNIFTVVISDLLRSSVVRVFRFRTPPLLSCPKISDYLSFLNYLSLVNFAIPEYSLASWIK